MSNIREVIDAWKPYIAAISDWQKLVQHVEPKLTQCGPVYEIPNPIEGRENESFAISDMRQVKRAAPHYHTNGETEIYFILQGEGLTVDGGKEIPIKQGSIVITPPNTAHFTIPKQDLVLVVINTPPFSPHNCIDISETDEKLGFDKAQYERLTAAL